MVTGNLVMQITIFNFKKDGYEPLYAIAEKTLHHGLSINYLMHAV